ncbi:MAG: 4Fe-4S dicluster domain-containing protein [Deltaproteobacteria bacterium]|nr:4Fe-4S dicluster domain-containing protein [Deltaproteobacteria bacterium]
MVRKAMLIDESKCTACRGCQVACKQWNDLGGWTVSKTVNRGSYENPPRLAPQTWTRIKFTEYEGQDGFRWLFLKEGCMHCGDPACVRVCPTKALKQGTHGRVTVEPDLCNGCGYCTQFCPFDIPRLEVSSLLTGRAKVFKCNFCQDRTDNGLVPSCVKTCPAQALFWGDRDGMIAAGKKRLEVLKARGFPRANLYGENLVGGLGRLYVLVESPEAYGLPADPKVSPLTTVWQDIVHPLGKIALGGTILGTLVAWFIIRRNIKMEEVE